MKNQKWDGLMKTIDGASTWAWHAFTIGVSAIMVLFSVKSTLDDINQK